MNGTLIRYKTGPRPGGRKPAADRKGFCGAAREIAGRRALYGLAAWRRHIRPLRDAPVRPRRTRSPACRRFSPSKRASRSAASSRRTQPKRRWSATTGCCVMLTQPSRSGVRPADRRAAAEPASLLRPHGRIGHRWRGCRAGGACEGHRGFSRPPRQSPIRRGGSSALPTMPRWIFCADDARQSSAHSGEDPDMIVDPTDVVERRQAAAASLRSLHGPPSQRAEQRHPDGCARLFAGRDRRHHGRDHSRGESRPASRLARAFASWPSEPDDRPLPRLAERERSRLSAYVDRFNARDFEAVRDMLADEVRLELVAKTRLNGKREVSHLLHQLCERERLAFRSRDWSTRAQQSIARDPRRPVRQARPILSAGVGGEPGRWIRDFRHARYAIEASEVFVDD